ncbi:MAG: recombinase [Marinilabiliales bacterium]|nr:MAG: recombinase [Marinilabiliales bacterium]
MRNTFSLLIYVKKNRINSNGEIPVYLRITLNGKIAEMSLNRKVLLAQWSVQSSSVIGKSKFAADFNRYLLSIQSGIYEHYKLLREREDHITPVMIKNSYFGIEEVKYYVIKIFQEHNEKFKQLVDKEYSYATYERYETCLKHTQEFIKHQYNKDDYPLAKVNHEFISNYEFYLKTKRNCAHNTAMKYLKNFKKIIRIAMIEGRLKNDPFANFKLKLEKVDRGFLSEEELQTLIDKDLRIERLQQVRDCFVFSCFTGLAYSDLKKLNKDSLSIGVDKNIWVQTNRTKTSTQCNIPLFPPAQEIINKYSDNPYCLEKNVLLPVLSNQKYNAYLKEIADLCGINRNLTTHLARHTFATTVTLNNDVPIESVSKMLGHSSLSMTRIYARLLDKRVSSDTQHLHNKYGRKIV